MDQQEDRLTCWRDCETLGVAGVRARLSLDPPADPRWRMHAEDWLQARLRREGQIAYRLVLAGITGSALAITLLAVL